MKSFNLDSDLAYLAHVHRFFAEFIQQMRVITTDKVPLAGVSVTDRINLYINPEKWVQLTQGQKNDVLIHECEHVARLHMFRAKKLGKDSSGMNTQQNANIAMDAPINEGLQHIGTMVVDGKPFTPITIQSLATQLKLPLDKNKPWEYYLDAIKEAVDKGNIETCDGGDSLDDHGVWEESDDISEDMAKEKVKDAMQKAKANSAGSMPSSMLAILDALCTNTVPWKRALKMFIAKNMSMSRQSTRKRRNRRYGLLYQGTKKTHALHLAIAVDTSGSVSDRELQQFFSEIDYICQQNVKITVIQADAEVKKESVKEYKRKQKIEIHGRGGTLYAPAIKYAEKEMKVDGLIYLGDGDCFESPDDIPKPKFPVMWAFTRKSKAPVSWGKLVHVELGEEK